MPSQKTGMAGLDKILGGGVPEGKALLLLAPPGTGKTTLCNSFAVETIKSGGKLLYISTAYPFDEFERALGKAGTKCEPGHCAFIDCFSWRQPGENPPSAENTTVMKSIEDLNELTRQIKRMSQGKIDAIVLDSITDLVLYSDPKQVYKFLQLLQGILRKNRTSGLMSLEFGLHDEKINNTINYIFDGVVEMRANGKREIRVTRMSGMPHPRNWVEFKIEPKLQIMVVSK